MTKNMNGPKVQSNCGLAVIGNWKNGCAVTNLVKEAVTATCVGKGQQFISDTSAGQQSQSKHTICDPKSVAGRSPKQNNKKNNYSVRYSD